jgi:hypothetical protein
MAIPQRFEDLRHDVLRRDEVNVVAADLLQIEHDLRKLGRADFRAFAELAGLEVLAEDAAQIAPAEKDRARAIPAAQTIFFTEMRKRAGYARKPPALADSNFIVVAVDLAVTRADAARTERFDRFDSALLKNALFERFYVRRNKVFACQNKSPAAI